MNILCKIGFHKPMQHVWIVLNDGQLYKKCSRCGKVLGQDKSYGCDNCEYRLFPVTRSPCDNCAMSGDKYFEWTAQTNADCIRSMTDEELSSWISDHVDCNRRCEALKDGCMDSDSTCMAAWLEWLKEEVATVIPADNQGGDA